MLRKTPAQVLDSNVRQERPNDIDEIPHTGETFMLTAVSQTRAVKSVWLASLAMVLALPASAQSPSTPSPEYKIGTSLEATADPTVPRPNTKPCVVTLLSNQAFADFNNKNFNFTPPADCPGPWAKVVFTADFSIQAGVQFDRTGQVFFGNVNIYFGTTAEPLQNQTDTWHVERDLTDYSSLFMTPQTGYASLGNIVGADGLTSTIFGTFKLEFYQADFGNPAPRTADLVLPLPDNGNGSVQLNNSNPELTQAFTLPKNVESAYLDVIAQSQNQEEQWFLCLPNSVASDVGDCGNTAFRQVDVSIDGKPAGVAPVFPWIYTGGVDPGLWIPIPGVQTLNLLPYRVDLTPFAGVLSNGQQHTVGVTVFNAFEYFSTVATLLVYEDHGSKQVTGAVTEDTLADPNPTVVNNVIFNSSGIGGGSVIVTSVQNFTIAGYVNTSHGRVGTKIDGNVNFSTAQTVTSTATTFGQSVVQTSTVNAKTTTQMGPFFTTKESNVSYPFNISFLETVESNGNIGQVTTVDQNFQRTESDTFEGFPIFHSSVGNEVSSGDTATFIASPTGFSLGPNSGQSSKQIYDYKDSLGHCYSRELQAANNVLSTVTDDQGCHQH
jgi:Peptide N-acetyl-beta-D-glucosaminyl asparaginase amidase A